MIEDLLARNKAWSAERKAERADYFERHAIAAAGHAARGPQRSLPLWFGQEVQALPRAIGLRAPETVGGRVDPGRQIKSLFFESGKALPALSRTRPD